MIVYFPRFVKQQEELLSLREENEALRSKANKGGRGNWEKKAQALEGQVTPLRCLLQYHALSKLQTTKNHLRCIRPRVLSL